MRFSKRMETIPRSFVRDILKVTEDDEIISFSGGLPNPISFPIEELKVSVNNILGEYGVDSLQYSTTEGYEPLREIIAERYLKYGLNVNSDNILITTGSQQCLDLVAKVFIDEGDVVLVENPTYLAALQSFSVFKSVFKTVPLCSDGLDLDELEDIFKKDTPKLFYSIPSFQNPTGICYSSENRKKLSELLKKYHYIY